MGDDLSYGLNTLGPLCLWQCLFLNVHKKGFRSHETDFLVSGNRFLVPGNRLLVPRNTLFSGYDGPTLAHLFTLVH